MVVFLSLAVECVFLIHEKCESSVAKAWEGRKKPCASFVQQTRHKTQDMCVQYQRWNETRRHFFCVQLKLCSFVVSSLTHVSFQRYLIILTAWKKNELLRLSDSQWKSVLKVARESLFASLASSDKIMESSLNSIYHIHPTETFKWYPSASSENCREFIIFLSCERVASCKHQLSNQSRGRSSKWWKKDDFVSWKFEWDLSRWERAIGVKWKGK